MSIALSSDGNILAICAQVPNNWAVELWDIQLGHTARRTDIYGGYIDGFRGMEWSPTSKLLLVDTDIAEIWLIDVLKRKSRQLDVYPMTEASWYGDKDQILVDLANLEGKPVKSLLNVRTDKHVRFDLSWIREDDYNVACSVRGDLAVEFRRADGTSAIAPYAMKQGRHKWIRGTTISSPVSKSGTVQTEFMLITWLLDGRLAYAVMYPADQSDNSKNVELWTCKRDGSDQKKWLNLGLAQPPYPLENWTGLWPKISVSANGKRVAFFRNDKVFVLDTAELAKSSVESPK